MHPLTAEWIGKAEGDFATAQRELRARSSPNKAMYCCTESGTPVAGSACLTFSHRVYAIIST